MLKHNLPLAVVGRRLRVLIAEALTPCPSPASGRGELLLDARLALLVLVAMIVGGCGRDGPQRVIVSGTVTFRGEPLKDGQIRFVPAEGTKAPISGTTIIDGRYAVQVKGGVPVGTHRIEIVAFRPDPRFRELTESLGPDATELERPPEQQYIPEKYNTKSELEITIPPDSRKITRDFELSD